jgi:hypothetical protein
VIPHRFILPRAAEVKDQHLFGIIIMVYKAGITAAVLAGLSTCFSIEIHFMICNSLSLRHI